MVMDMTVCVLGSDPWDRAGSYMDKTTTITGTTGRSMNVFSLALGSTLTTLQALFDPLRFPEMISTNQDTQVDTEALQQNGICHTAKRLYPGSPPVVLPEEQVKSAMQHGPGSQSAMKHDSGSQSAMKYDPGSQSAMQHGPGSQSAMKHGPGSQSAMQLKQGADQENTREKTSQQIPVYSWFILPLMTKMWLLTVTKVWIFMISRVHIQKTMNNGKIPQKNFWGRTDSSLQSGFKEISRPRTNHDPRVSQAASGQEISTHRDNEDQKTEEMERSCGMEVEDITHIKACRTGNILKGRIK